MNAKLVDKVCRVFFIFVFVMGTISVPHQTAKAQELIPHIAAWPDSSWVQASGWHLGALITMTIDDPGTPQPVDYTAQSSMGPNPQNPSEPIAKFAFQGEFILKAGHVITMTDGSTTGIYTVTQLQVTFINLQNDTVSGIATPNSQVDVCANVQGGQCTPRHVTAANPSGVWMADYHIPGTQPNEQETLDLRLDANGVVSETDANGNWTGANWSTPFFTASPVSNSIRAERWPVGAFITISIDNPSTTPSPDFTTTQVATADSGQSYGRGGSFHYKSTYNFSAGDTITLTDGITIKSLVISPVRITSIDLVNDRITGVTDPNRKMWVTDNNIMIQFQSNPDGTWIADFTGKTDLQLDKAGRVEVFDDDGDETNVDLPNPYIEAFTNGGLHARNWLPGTVVTLTIDRPSTSQSPDYTTTQTVGPAPWNPDINAAEFDLRGIYPYQVGDLITVSDGMLMKMLTVTNVAVTNIDPVAGTISGTTDPNTEVEVDIRANGAPYRKVTADGSGQWTADFSTPWNDQGTYDLIPGLYGIATSYDYDGDQTVADWNVPIPNFDVRANYDQVEAYQWDMGNTLTITIDNPATADNPDYTATQTVTGMAPWDLSQTYLPFYLSGVYDIQAGDTVSVSNGIITKTTVVTNLAITDVHLDTDMVEGTVEPNQTVNVWTCWQNTCANRDETADQDGHWVTNFAIPGEQDWEQDMLDIRHGSWIDSSVNDEDGDSTMFGWYVPDQPSFSPFVVFGQEGVWIKENSDVVSGDVGANISANGPYLTDQSEVTIGQHTRFLNPDSRVLGDTLYLKQGSQTYDVYYNELQGLGLVLGDHHTPVDLPLFQQLPAVPSVTPGTQNFSLPINGTLTLNAGNYGKLEAKKGATINFTGGVYHFTEWTLGDNIKVYFAAPTEIRIAGRLDIGTAAIVGPAAGTDVTAQDIFIYVLGVNGNTGNLGATPKAAKFGMRTTLNANVYTPNGTLWIRERSTATGAFFGLWVTIGENVTLAHDNGW